MIKKLHIDDFRIFKNQDILIGETLTAIAGQNGTGKSTILSILGNCCEVKSSTGKTITGKQFRTEFSEIMKGSKKHDPSSGEIGSIEYTLPDGFDTDPVLSMRVSWQKWKPSDTENNRFRIIPKKHYDPIQNKETEAKLPIASYHLGLSRLIPLGEQPDDEINEFRISKSYLTDYDLEWLYCNYINILSLPETNIESISNYSIGNKISGGINTDTYDYLTNSSGQDNIMQILYILLSFLKLKQSFDISNKVWNGAIFTIDEIDATLHPKAQIKLIDLMHGISKEINLQIIFTTHSLQLLDYLNSRLHRNTDISISYLTTANDILQIKNNPEYEFMENDMLISNYYSSKKISQLTLYSEDDEARWFLKHLLKDYATRINIIETKLGSDVLLSLLYNDPSYFQNVLFILDGDHKDITGKYKKLPSKYCNILSLPGSVSPEELIFNYLLSLPPEHEILTSYASKGISLRYFKENNPLTSSKYDDLHENREKYKKWFIDTKVMLEDIDVLRFWQRDNAKEYQNFLNEFVNKFNIVASRNNLPKII